MGVAPPLGYAMKKNKGQRPCKTSGEISGYTFTYQGANIRAYSDNGADEYTSGMLGRFHRSWSYHRSTKTLNGEFTCNLYSKLVTTKRMLV
jgi:hypothetical protein